MESGTNSKLQIGANIAILLGLVMVAFQINQANDISSAEFLDAGITADNERQLAILGENPNESMYRVLHAPDTATPEDYFIADRVYETLTAQVQRSIMLTEADLYLGSVRGLVRDNHELFACPYGIAYLDQLVNRIERNINGQNGGGGNGGGDRVASINEEFVAALRRLRNLASAGYSRGDFNERISATDALIKSGIRRQRPRTDNNDDNQAR